MADDKSSNNEAGDKSMDNRAGNNPTDNGAGDGPLDGGSRDKSMDHEAGDNPTANRVRDKPDDNAQNPIRYIARQIQDLSQETLLDLFRQVFPRPPTSDDESEQAERLGTIIQAVTPRVAISAIHGIDRSNWSRANIKALNYGFYVEQLRSYPANLVTKSCLQDRLNEEIKIENPTPEDLTNRMFLDEQLEEAQRRQDVQEGVYGTMRKRSKHNRSMNRGHTARDTLSGGSMHDRGNMRDEGSMHDGSIIGEHMGRDSSAVGSIAKIAGPNYTREEEDEIIRRHAEAFQRSEQERARNDAMLAAGMLSDTVSGPVGHPEASVDQNVREFGKNPFSEPQNAPTSNNVSGQFSTVFKLAAKSKARSLIECPEAGLNHVSKELEDEPLQRSQNAPTSNRDSRKRVRLQDTPAVIPISNRKSELSTDLSQNIYSEAKYFTPEQTSMSAMSPYDSSTKTFIPDPIPPIQPTRVLHLSPAEHHNRVEALASTYLKRSPPPESSQTTGSNWERPCKRQRASRYGDEYDSMVNNAHGTLMQNLGSNSRGRDDFGANVDDEELWLLYSLEMIQEQEQHEAEEKKNKEGGH